MLRLPASCLCALLLQPALVLLRVRVLHVFLVFRLLRVARHSPSASPCAAPPSSPRVLRLLRARLPAPSLWSHRRRAAGTAGQTDGSAAWLAQSDFDFLLFDTQHSPTNLKELGPIIATTTGGNAVPIVRVGQNVADQICYALDAGAKGVVVPMVNTRAEAEACVAAVKYHPDGVYVH